jgi:hypothetical protein
VGSEPSLAVAASVERQLVPLLVSLRAAVALRLRAALLLESQPALAA